MTRNLRWREDWTEGEAVWGTVASSQCQIKYVRPMAPGADTFRQRMSGSTLVLEAVSRNCEQCLSILVSNARTMTWEEKEEPPIFAKAGALK
jgi:hypothetical protein